MFCFDMFRWEWDICFVLICSVGNGICFVLIRSVGNGIYVLLSGVQKMGLIGGCNIRIFVEFCTRKKGHKAPSNSSTM